MRRIAGGWGGLGRFLLRVNNTIWLFSVGFILEHAAKSKSIMFSYHSFSYLCRVAAPRVPQHYIIKAFRGYKKRTCEAGFTYQHHDDRNILANREIHCGV